MATNCQIWKACHKSDYIAGTFDRKKRETDSNENNDDIEMVPCDENTNNCKNGELKQQVVKPTKIVKPILQIVRCRQNCVK